VSLEGSVESQASTRLEENAFRRSGDRRSPPASRRTRLIPAAAASTLDALALALARTLGSRLLGVFLHGSLTQRAFDPARSDLDCMVVVRRELTSSQVARMRKWLARAARTDPWMTRIHMQVLLQGRLLRSDSRGHLYQFGVWRRSGSDGNPIVWLNILASGIALTGAQPGSFLPPITAEMLFDALVREVGYLRAEIMDPASRWRRRRFYRAYAVLTLCRILYTHAKGRVVSKPEAARWALRMLPTRWHALVRAAAAADRARPRPLPLSRIARFIQFAEAQLRSPAGRARGTSAGSPKLG
jgi:hypothetical protein